MNCLFSGEGQRALRTAWSRAKVKVSVLRRRGAPGKQGASGLRAEENLCASEPSAQHKPASGQKGQRRFTEDCRKYLNNRVKHSVGLSAEWVEQLPPPSYLTLSPDHVLVLEENTDVDGKTECLGMGVGQSGKVSPQRGGASILRQGTDFSVGKAR